MAVCVRDIFKGVTMEGTPAVYLGRIVSKENFRVFIYGQKGLKKCVNSWDEYERHMQTGLWFASIEEVSSPVDEPVTPVEPICVPYKNNNKSTKSVPKQKSK
jgi:hypothetical protein